MAERGMSDNSVMKDRLAAYRKGQLGEKTIDPNRYGELT